MRSRQKLGDLHWFMKQFTEELHNRWSDFTFEMLLALAKEEMKVRREEMKDYAGSIRFAHS